MDDLISRQAAIDALDEIESEVADGYGYQYEKWRKYFCGLPSAQSERKKGKFDRLRNDPEAEWVEIIRCKDCKYQDEGYRRISVKWLPCMDVRVPSLWYCGSAKRREDE